MNIQEVRKQAIDGRLGNGIPSFFPPPVLFCSVPEMNSPADYVVLWISNGNGKEVLYMTVDGQIHFSEEMPATEQARCFCQAINIAAQRAVFPLGQ